MNSIETSGRPVWWLFVIRFMFFIRVSLLAGVGKKIKKIKSKKLKKNNQKNQTMKKKLIEPIKILKKPTGLVL